MKNYETGICDRCDKPADQHHRYGDFLYCSDSINSDDDFKDSGLAQLEKNAPKLWERAKAVVDAYNESTQIIDGDEVSTVMSEALKIEDAIAELEEAINEALKRE